MFDEGTGPAIILIPGVQGRWEWMKPALRELQKRCRTVTYTLSGDLGSEMKYDPAIGFDNYIRQLDDVFEKTGLDRAALCGVSYGGFIAVRYAALRPERVTSLIIASSPSPGWVPSKEQQRYIARPWISAPAFVLTAPLRIWPEVRAAFDTPADRLMFLARHGMRAVTAPMMPRVMAGRVRLQQEMDFAPDCAEVKAPTLVVTGDDQLDRIVPPEITRRYCRMIPGAQYARMEGTGHLGSLTRSAQFSELVSRFVYANRQ